MALSPPWEWIPDQRSPPPPPPSSLPFWVCRRLKLNQESVPGSWCCGREAGPEAAEGTTGQVGSTGDPSVSLKAHEPQISVSGSSGVLPREVTAKVGAEGCV